MCAIKVTNKLSMQWRQAQGGGGGAESPNLDPLLHQFQPPGARLQRLRQLPHLLLLRQRLQARSSQCPSFAPLVPKV